MTDRFDDMTQARTEAAQEIADAILCATRDALLRHGEDPESGAVIALGFAMAIEKMRMNDPACVYTIQKLLGER